MINDEHFWSLFYIIYVILALKICLSLFCGGERLSTFWKYLSSVFSTCFSCFRDAFYFGLIMIFENSSVPPKLRNTKMDSYIDNPCNTANSLRLEISAIFHFLNLVFLFFLIITVFLKYNMQEQTHTHQPIQTTTGYRGRFASSRLIT